MPQETKLKETTQAGVATKAITPTQLSHNNLDTIFQTKAIRYSTDSRLYDRVREQRVAQARKAGLEIKQIYDRVGKHLVMKVSHYAHARQMKRRAAVEPTVGRLESDHRLDRNALRGPFGGSINAILSAAAMNFGKLLRFFSAFFQSCLIVDS